MGILHFYLMTKLPIYYVYLILPLMTCIVQVSFSIKLIGKVFRVLTQQESSMVFVKRKMLFLTFLEIVIVVSYMVVMYLVPYETATLLSQSTFMLPQIYFNMKRAKKERFLTGYYLGYLSARCILPLYYRGCPANIFRLEPSFGLCTLWLSSYTFQLVIVFLQAQLGGRFFIPKCCLFLYQDGGYRLMTTEDSLERSSTECNICLEELSSSNVSMP